MLRSSALALIAVALLVASIAPLTAGPVHDQTSYGAPGGAVTRATLPPSPVVYHPVVVTSGTTLYWNGTGESDIQYQQGSVTVEPGGSLVIQNLTLSMVQFVSSTGTLAERLSNISTIVDEGRMVLRSAILTTDASVADAYLKLNLSVTGSLTLWHSSLEFPGWLAINGSGDVTLNQSVVGSNPAANETGLSPTVVADTSFAPSVSVSGYGHLVLLDSRLENTYRDNTTEHGLPGMVPLSDSQVFTITPTMGKNLTALETPDDSGSLIQDWLYPTAVFGGTLQITYTSTVGLQATPTVDLNGSLFTLVPAAGGPTTSPETVATPLSGALIHAINSAGIYKYLLDTGSFSTPPGRISINISGNALGPATISNVSIVLSPPLAYNLGVSGTGASLDAIDSSFDINWEPAPFNPVVQFPPYPWDSNKLVASAGASVTLANVTIPAALPSTNLTSAILADNTSHVFTYRWAQFNVSGPGGLVPGATVTAFSQASGTSNRTVNDLNDLNRSAPALWSYIQWWDGENHLPGYGRSGSAGAYEGRAFLLLVSSNLTDTDAINATYLGTYHAGVRVPVASTPTQWVTANVTPYPLRLVDPSPDLAPSSYFPEFAAALSIRGFSFSADGVNNTGEARIGQILGVVVTVNSSGETNVSSVSGQLEYVGPGTPGGVVVASYPLTNITIPPGGSSQLNFSWQVNESVVGAQGTVSAGVIAIVDWNGGPSQLNGGTTNAGTALLVLPSTIAIRSFSAPPQNLSPTQTYTSNGVVIFNGSGLATIKVIAIPQTGNDTPIVLVTAFARNGSFTVQISNLNQFLTPGVPYQLVVTATYNTANATPFALTGNYTLVSPAPAPAGLAIPWWTWVVVGIAAVLGVVGFLVVRRRPKGQIECGECAALAREGSVTCPQCGIYFELGESRCPRCGVPILTGQLSCPECHYIPSDRPSPPGPEEDRQAYRTHVDQFRAAAQGEIGEDYPEVEFWKWWRHQASYQSFRDWKTGQTTRPAGPLSGDPDPMGMGDGR